MELRHLRCFLAVAEELHFARAAERLHIEQSPLSRAIKELEEDLGVQLFVRTTRSTRLTRAGMLFLEYVPRVLTALQQARDSVKAAANGFHGQLRVALSDGIPPSRFSTFLALCRQEEPEIEIRLSEVPLAQQIKGLHDDLYDVGFAQSDEAAPIAADVLHDMAVKSLGPDIQPSADERKGITRQCLGLLRAAVGKPAGRRALRTLQVGALLHAALRWNRTQKLDAHDIFDFHHAGAALGYCGLPD